MEQKSTGTALLVMDVQNAIVNSYKDTNVTLLGNLARTIDAARKSGIPVLYVVVGFRKGYPEVNKSNKSFTVLKNSGRNFDTEDAMRVADAIKPIDSEPVIVKKRISAFTGSDLEVILRSYGIKHLVLTGIATSGVVLSTLREAADKDYQLTVLADCCGDMDEEVHRVLTTKIFPRQADVMNHEQWMENIG